MDIKGKVIRLDSLFQKSAPLPTTGETIDSIFIEGYANTTSVDSILSDIEVVMRDVITSEEKFKTLFKKFLK